MATYKFVPEHSGIEIYFDTKPSEYILDELRRNGWRWHQSKKCWFTKNSVSAKVLAEKLCKSHSSAHESTVISKPTSINVIQCMGMNVVSTLTITRYEQGYNIASSNNQIVCCDCTRFFSIHAQACPFCGCPTSYIAEQVFKQYSNTATTEQNQEQKAKEHNLAQKRAYKELKEICQQWGWDKERACYQLVEEDLMVLERAISRVKQLKEASLCLPYISTNSLIELLTIDDYAYKKKVSRLIADQKEESDSNRVQDKANKALKKIYYLKIESTCAKYGISKRDIDKLIEANIIVEELQKRLETIDYYRKYFPSIGIGFETHLFVSSYKIKEEANEKIGILQKQ